MIAELPSLPRRARANVPTRYSGLPVLSPKCSNEICRNQAACSIEVTYRFPQWFVARALHLVAAKTCIGDPVFGLTIQRRVEYTRQDNIIRFAMTGNNEG